MKQMKLWMLGAILAICDVAGMVTAYDKNFDIFQKKE